MGARDQLGNEQMPSGYLVRVGLVRRAGALLDVKTLEDASEKYLISLDGQTCSSRFEKLLGLNSAVLKQDSPYYGFYYRALRAYEQYLPFWVNGQKDILGVIQWATENDEAAWTFVLLEGTANSLLQVNEIRGLSGGLSKCS
eukprot:gene11724-13845_t